jgi:predicted short-subunit dehydrogenase-like oxidoreductase (DUF2520 family)
VRELDFEPTSSRPGVARLTIVGAGRLGSAIAPALRSAGLRVTGPLRRGEPVPADAEVVLLCVGDAAIGAVAASIPPGALVGHCSGATGLDVLGNRESFSLHPLLSVTDGVATRFAGAGCAIAGSSPRARATALGLAEALDMRPVEVADGDRIAYHAAASIAANFLVCLEGAAERLAATAGVERDLLVPLVSGAVANWSRLGARRALTGPIVRGDEAVVSAQRAAVAERTPELLAVFDAMADLTRTLASEDPSAG